MKKRDSGQKLELLAPVQNKECAIAAINYGADALYMGAQAYGARSKAPNSLEDIEAVINYAHKFGVKVYITINTILNDRELIEAQKLIEKLYAAGADAIIIQDMGLLELAVEGKLPPIKLFASTQCDNRTLEKVKFLESVGVSRIILARELSVGEIENISENTNIEIETFVHGSLCVSYSGQCYLSYACGGRSANKGECAQVCRKKYSLVNEKGKILAKEKHLLNLKDFNASKQLDALVQAGVTSFKIEGRMKDISYVKNVVGYYRKLLDSQGHLKTSSGKIFFDFEPAPEKSFNRSFSEYFLSEKTDNGQIHNFDTPKSLGEELGEVVEVKKNHFSLSTHKKISPQDGLCMVIDGELVGCLVNEVDGNKIFPNKMPKIRKGALAYRNSDAEFEKKLASSKTVRKLGVKFKVSDTAIEAVDEDGNFVKKDFSTDEKAQNMQKMCENILSQLNKCGESDFWVEDIEIETEELPFLPVSKINELRREIFVLLTKERLKNYKRDIQKPLKHSKYPAKSGDYKLNIHNSLAKTFMAKCECEVKETSLESGTSTVSKELMRCKYCIRRALDICAKGKVKEEFYLLDDKKRRLELNFDCKNCEMVILSKEKL